MEDSGKKKKVYPIFVIVCTIVCTIAGIYGVLYIVLFASAFESVQKSREQSIQMDCDIALLPDLAGLIDRQGSKDGYSVYETRHYKSVEALCEVMPEGFGDAIWHTLRAGTCRETTDLKDAKVQSYEITEGLPFVSEQDIYGGYVKAAKLAAKQVNVLRYANGDLRIQLMVTYPDEAFTPDRTLAKNQTIYVFQKNNMGVGIHLPSKRNVYGSFFLMDGQFLKVTADVEWLEGYYRNLNGSIVKEKKHPEVQTVKSSEAVSIEEVYRELYQNSDEEYPAILSLEGYTDEGDYFFYLDVDSDPIYRLYQNGEIKYVYVGCWLRTEYGDICYAAGQDKKAVLQRIKDSGVLCCAEYFVVPESKKANE